MNTALAPDRPTEFMPTEESDRARSFGLALLAHGLLAAALMVGVQWKRELPPLTAEAELWSSVPQQAAPRDVQPPIEPPPQPSPVKPAPPLPPKPAPEPPPDREAEIALEKKRQQQKAQTEIEERRERDKRRLETERREAEHKAAEKKAAERKAEEKTAEDKKRHAEKAQADKQRREQEEARQLNAQRQENLKRMAGLAGASGGPTATGAALQSSGPSASYAGRIRARIKPNIVFTDDISGNPVADVEVRTTPDGTILSRKLIKSSGVSAWDEAVLKAIDKTEILPRDTDGRVPSPLIIGFRPKD